jgi:dephospho-CoA kinase
MRRMGIERAAAKAMIESQMPLDEKIKRGDHVVWNNDDRAVLANQAVRLVELWRQEKWTK